MIKEAADSAGTARPRAADRILDAARELFYREGIRAVGVDEVVARASATKPSLYRSFSSKDELAAAYLRLYEAEFWARFDAAMALHPGDPKAQILGYLEGLAERIADPSYRGCGLTNAAVEYPEPAHPARRVSELHKAELRRRLLEMSRAIRAEHPELLADGLFLLMEGALVSTQIFHAGGPSTNVARVAALLIAAATA